MCIRDRKGEALYLNLSATGINTFNAGNNDGINGTMEFRGTLGKQIEDKLRGEIYEELKCCAVNNIPRKITNILEVMKLAAHVEDFVPETDKIHFSFFFVRS